MSMKTGVEAMAEDVAGQVEHLPERAREARKMVGDWAEDVADRGIAMVRQYPGRSVLGAFLIGFAIAKVAKHA